MRTSIFFKEKALAFISQIDTVLADYTEGDEHKSFTKAPFAPTPEDNKLTEEEVEYNKQESTIIDLEFKVRMMFSEFENGESFINKYNPKKKPFNELYSGRFMYMEKDKRYREGLEKVKQILNLFVEHIDEYKL